MTKQETKKFSLRILLTVTTGRLLTESKGPQDNGIGDLYDILGFMTADTPFTHQLGRFAKECEPWLLRWFPELASVSLRLDALDRWIAADSTGTAEEGVKMWLAETKIMFPALQEMYNVPRIPQDDHERKHPYDELVVMRGTDEGIIPIVIEEIK